MDDLLRPLERPARGCPIELAGHARFARDYFDVELDGGVYD